MPRGAIAKRSKSPGIAGPPGPAGLGPFAFQSIAVMAAFPAAALVDGVDAHVFTLDEMWSYDPSSALVPDVTAYAPLGITIVAANGPGNWTRREATSLRWRERATWFVDPIAGDDEADGATTLTAVGTFAEVMRRLQGLPMATTGYDVTIMSDLNEVVVIDTRHTSGTNALYIHAAPILLFAGVITAHVDYNDATQTVGTITVAGLPVSFTASGLVGKLVRMPGGAGPTAIEFWIMQDMGAKTARISPPQAGIFTTAVATVTNTAFEVYELVQFGTLVSVLSTGGESEQIDFETLRLGTFATAHAVEFKNAPALIESCLVGGLDTYAGSEDTYYNCSFQEVRCESGGHVLLVNGYCPFGGGSVQVRPHSLVTYTRFISYTTYLVQQGALLVNEDTTGWIGFIDTGGLIGLQIESMGFVDTQSGTAAPARFWTVGQGAGDTGIFIFPLGRLEYDSVKRPIVTGAATEIVLGNTSKTITQLPYTNPIDNAAAIEKAAPDPNEDYFLALAADTNVAVNVYADLLTQVINVNGLRDVLFDVTYSVVLIGATEGNVVLEIDGVIVIGSTFHNPAPIVASEGSGSMRWRAVLDRATNPHTIRVRWKVVSGQAFCRPATQLEFESCTLTIRELYG